MSIRLYVDETLPLGRRFSLPEGPARHLAAVLRAKPGDRVSLFDGQGREVQAQVLDVGRRQVEVEIISECSHMPMPSLITP